MSLWRPTYAYAFLPSLQSSVLGYCGPVLLICYYYCYYYYVSISSLYLRYGLSRGRFPFRGVHSVVPLARNILSDIKQTRPTQSLLNFLVFCPNPRYTFLSVVYCERGMSVCLHDWQCSMARWQTPGLDFCWSVCIGDNTYVNEHLFELNKKCTLH